MHRKKPCDTAKRTDRFSASQIAGFLACVFLLDAVSIGTSLIDQRLTTDQPTDPVVLVGSGSPGALTLGTAKLVLTTGTQNTQSSYVFTAEVPLDHHLQMVMQQAAEKYGVPYALLLAIAEQESSFDTTADNGVCYGLMQIHPINYARLRGLGIEPTDTAGNIFAGALIIGEYLDRYSDTSIALMAYNCGESGASALWDQGCYSSDYSIQVISREAKWQDIIEQKT